MGLMSGLLCRPVKFFLIKSLIYGHWIVHKRGIVMLYEKKALSKLLSQIWKHTILKNVIVCQEYFDIYYPSGIKGPGQIVCPLNRNGIFTNFLSLTKLYIKRYI